jgi:FkbM family methyltransferase
MTTANRLARWAWHAITPVRLKVLHRFDGAIQRVRLDVRLQRLIQREGLKGLGPAGLRFYSQWGEDRVLDPFVGDRGWVVDVGANDGLRGSNSRHFVLKGLSAICIEPDPRPRQTLSALYHDSKSVRVYGCCCAGAEGVKSLHLGANSELSSIVPDAQAGGPEVAVQARPLDDILVEAGVDSIAVLSIDVEGAEWQVLQGLTISRWQPRFVVIETHSDISGEVNPSLGIIAGYMDRAGYALCGVTRSNCLWAAPGVGAGWLTRPWHSRRADDIKKIVDDAVSARAS